MVTFTKDYGKRIKHMGKGSTDIWTEPFIKVNGTRTNSTEKEKRNGQISLNMREIS